MKNLSFVSFLALLIFFSSCKPKAAWERRGIEEKEKKLVEKVDKGLTDTNAINQLLAAYESYADAYPGDTNGANYLFKAGDFYRYLRKPNRSIEVYQKLYTNYPTLPKRPYALFLQGFIYENELAQIDSARAIYQRFISLYPDNPITGDVKITLENLGKSPEQLVAEFEARQKADSAAAAQEGK